MTQQFFNSMLALLFAKFMLNDVPHAVGMFGVGSWVDYGWKMLVEFTIPHSIYLDAIAKEGLADGSISELGLKKYKAMMGCYYLLFIGEAPDEAVNAVYGLIKRALREGRGGMEKVYSMPLEQFIKVLRREEGVPEDRLVLSPPPGPSFLNAMERHLWLESKLVDGTRLDKVVVIDAIMHLEHEEGSYVGWVIGEGIRDTELDYVTMRVVQVISR